MPATHTIYYVRHGQCVGNVSGDVLPPSEDVLTDFGKKQAKTLGEYMNDVEFTRAYASTYSRAIDTATGILSNVKTPCQIEVKEDERICERDMGDMLGKPAKEVAMLTLEKLKEGLKFNEIEIPGGETMAVYEERMRSFFKDLFEELRRSEKSETVLIVSHGLKMRRFLVGLRDTFTDICTTTNWDVRCQRTIENTACTQMTLEYPSPSEKPLITLVKVHDIQHLKSLEKDTSNGAAKTDYAINEEMRRKLIEKVKEIPGAKEEISGCMQV